MKEPAPDPIRRHFMRRIVLGTGLLAGVLFLILTTFFLFLQTASGREWLRGRLSALLTSKPHQIVELGAITGTLPWDVRLESLVVGDSTGPWLTAQRLVLRWAPGNLLLGEVRIDELSAASVELKRFPQSIEEKPPAEAGRPAIAFKAPPFTIHSFSFPRLSIGREALGQAAELELAGLFRPLEPTGSRALALHLRRVDGGPALEAHLVGQLEKDKASLKLDMEVLEAADGLVSHLLGLRNAGDLDLRLTGNGPASAWIGSMEARATRRGSVTTAFSLALAKEVSAELSGVVTHVDTAPRGGEIITASTEAVFHLEAHHAQGKRVHLDNLEIIGNGFSLTAKGQLDLESQSVESTLSLRVSDLGAPASAASMELAGQGELCANVTGTLKDPHIDLSLDLQDVTAVGWGASSFLNHLRVETIPPASDGPDRVWRFSGAGRLSGLRARTGRPLPEESIAWTVDAELPPEADTIHLQALRLIGSHHRLDVQGTVNPSSLDLSLQADLQVQDTRALTRLLGREVPGALDLTLTVSGRGGTGPVTAKLAGKMAARGAPSDPLTGLIGPETLVSADFEIRDGKSVEVPHAILKSPVLEATGTGSIDMTGGFARGELLAAIPNLKPLSPLLEEDLSGAVLSGLKIEGPLDDLTVSHWIEGRQVRWRQQPPSEILSRLEASQVPRKPRGQWTLRVNQAAETLDASAGFELAGDRLRLNGLRMDGPGARLNGDMTVDLETRTAEGSLQGRLDDLARLGRFLGQPIGGSASLDVRLSAPRGSQGAAMKLNGKDLSSGAARLSRLEVDADFKDLGKIPRGTLQSELSGLEAGPTQVRTASLKVDGDRSRLAFTARASGRMNQEAELQLAGTLGQLNGARKLEISDFRGKFGTYPIRLKNRVSFEQSEQGISLDGLSVALGPGTLAAEGHMTEARVQGRLSVDDLPLELAALAGGPDWSGRAQGKLEVSGSPAQPSCSVELQLAELRVRALEGRKLRPALINARARLDGGTVRGNVLLEQLLDQPAHLDFTMPLQASLSPRLAWEIPPGGPLRASAQLEGELGRLAGLLPFTDQTISGRARASLSLAGTAAEPVWGGEIQIFEGLYENLNSGTVLKGVNLEIAARDRQLQIRRFDATDGGRGQMSLTGRMEIDAARHFPMEIEAVLRDATLVRRNDMDATADGTVKLSGTVGAMLVEGDLTVAPAEYRIPDRLPGGAVELEVIEIDARGVRKEPEKAEASPSDALPLAFRLALAFPNRTYVRGRGLDSEWRGQMNISGTAAKPTLTGRLDVVRGRFDFLDRRFELTQGAITFVGTSPPDPLLDFKAESRAKDMTGLLRVTGAASSPAIQLDSDPPLPQEEVLARLLFGRSVDKISPIQALKLAQALKSLSGSSQLPGLDFVGATRRLLGLDQLDIRSTAGGSGTGLGLGKYLTEDVYVDVEKNLGGAGGKISVEVELTPNISVESEVGSDAQTGVGINWKYDY